MPDKTIEIVTTWREQISQVALFCAVGIAIGMGQLLASHEPLPPRIIIGRALSTGGLSMAAGLVLVWVPDLPLVGQIGVAAALASLGTSGLERVFQRVMQGRMG